MATFTRFEDMDAWRQARSLCAETYRISGNGLFAKDFGLWDQIRRASTSIMSNIAEGFERNGTREFVHFLAVAKGSAGEMRSQLYVALDQGYLDREEFSRLLRVATDTAKTIGALMQYLSKTGIKGSKYKSVST